MKGELIGRNTRAVNLRNKDVFEGKIIDETRNTFVLKTQKGSKRLIKRAYKFEFVHKDKLVVVDGKHLNKRPEERIKAKSKW